MDKKLRTVLFVVAICCSLIGCSKSSDSNSAGIKTVVSTHSDLEGAIKSPLNQSAVASKRQVQLPDFVNLVKQVGSTVVNITADNQEAAIIAENEMDPFAELFKHFGQQFQMPQPNTRKIQPLPQVRRAMGSGFIISADGYILTNAHVVKDAKKIIVKTTDKEELDAKIIGFDLKTDIALIKVIGKNLPVAKIGDPRNLEVGEWVAAIGAPFGFDNSVTQGIVSAKGRSLPSDSYVPFIQTDVPINPGNSGGPLFNLDGEVVGMNSQIYSRSGGYMGLSFSIPIDIAINIANQLKQFGKVSHGSLGVQIQSVTKQLAQSFGLPRATGALVSQLVPNGSAVKYGIKTGDIILRADGKEVHDATELPIIVGSAKPGYEMPLVIFRSGREMNLKVKLTGLNQNIVGDDAENDENSNAREAKADVVLLNKFGLSIKNLDKPAINSGLHGVLVVKAEAIAAMAGIIPNDIILKVNDKEVTTTVEVKRLLSGKNSVALLIARGGQQMFVTLSVN